MRNHLVLGGVALAAAAVTALTAIPASAAGPVLTYGSLGGSAVAVGDTMTASLLSGTNATLYSTTAGGTGLQCASSTFSGTVGSNPTAPGTASGSLTGFTLGSCKVVNTPGVTGVKSLTLSHLPYNDSMSDSSGLPNTVSAGSSGPIGATVVLNTLLGTVTCTYQAAGNLSSNGNNSNSSLTFSNQQFNKLTGPSACFSTAYFSGVYGPFVDSSQAGSPSIFVN
ncbi:Tat pathway signal sequence domain protein [Kitasatospora acidiphila]|uniref:Tat pathway signal sequence domain protein n=1 Tax=Kitasatospora acidiphila TaxID=2567942 RepID=A0A540WB03_9ACTN|nr:Tat pathway signal sequence domain protein [Kitasatospora acidiphila]TQF06142.1 Tat pathway signal sequence domain protein [Kitasatospora acidiphila]